MYCTNSIISNIYKTVEENVNVFKGIGLYEGVSGFSLLNYYLYLDTKESKYLDATIKYVEQAFDSLSQCNSTLQFSFHNIIEIGRYLCFLNSEGIINDKDLSIAILDLNPLYNDFFLKNQNDLSSLFGLIALGHFYLENNQKEYITKIKQIINRIDTLSIHQESSIFWVSKYENTDKIYPNLFNGSCGIIFFLALCYEKNIFKKKCLELIHKAIDYLYQNTISNNFNTFPVEIINNKRISYTNLAYGDIGIAYSLYRVGILIGSNNYKNKGINIFKKISEFRDDNNTYIKDAEIVYGSSGLFAIYSDLYQKTNINQFNLTANYWLKKTISHNNINNTWAGYDTYINGFDDIIQLSFAHV